MHDRLCGHHAQKCANTLKYIQTTANFACFTRCTSCHNYDYTANLRCATKLDFWQHLVNCLRKLFECDKEHSENTYGTERAGVKTSLQTIACRTRMLPYSCFQKAQWNRLGCCSVLLAAPKKLPATLFIHLIYGLTFHRQYMYHSQTDLICYSNTVMPVVFKR